MFLSGLQRLETLVAVLLVLAILALTTMQVVARYGMAEPFTWTEELARFGLIGLTFLGSALVMARGRHIVVDLNPEGAGAIRRVIGGIGRVFTVVGCAFLAYVAFLNALSLRGLPSPATGFPVAALYYAAGVSFSLMALHAALALAKDQDTTPTRGV